MKARHRLTLALAAALLFQGGLATAYTNLYRFQYCASVPDPGERLACYDNYAHELGLSAPIADGELSATQSRHGPWTVRGEATSDTTSVFVFTEGTAVTYPPSGVPAIPTLVARCSDRETQLFVVFSSDFPVTVGPLEKSALYSVPAKPELGRSTPLTTTTITFEGREPLDLAMRRSDDGRAFFFPNPVSFIRQMRKHNAVKFTYTPHGHPPMNAIFNLQSLDEALVNLRKACAW